MIDVRKDKITYTPIEEGGTDIDGFGEKYNELCEDVAENFDTLTKQTTLNSEVLIGKNPDTTRKSIKFNGPVKPEIAADFSGDKPCIKIAHDGDSTNASKVATEAMMQSFMYDIMRYKLGYFYQSPSRDTEPGKFWVLCDGRKFTDRGYNMTLPDMRGRVLIAGTYAVNGDVEEIKAVTAEDGTALTYAALSDCGEWKHMQGPNEVGRHAHEGKGYSNGSGRDCQGDGHNFAAPTENWPKNAADQAMMSLVQKSKAFKCYIFLPPLATAGGGHVQG